MPHNTPTHHLAGLHSTPSARSTSSARQACPLVSNARELAAAPLFCCSSYVSRRFCVHVYPIVARGVHPGLSGRPTPASDGSPWALLSPPPPWPHPSHPRCAMSPASLHPAGASLRDLAHLRPLHGLSSHGEECHRGQQDLAPRGESLKPPLTPRV